MQRHQQLETGDAAHETGAPRLGAERLGALYFVAEPALDAIKVIAVVQNVVRRGAQEQPQRFWGEQEALCRPKPDCSKSVNKWSLPLFAVLHE